jgi:hypothetical protein
MYFWWPPMIAGIILAFIVGIMIGILTSDSAQQPPWHNRPRLAGVHQSAPQQPKEGHVRRTKVLHN